MVKSRKHNKALSGTADRPRLSVFRSNSKICVQAIDDQNGKTLLQVNSKEIEVKKKTPIDIAKLVGESFAKKTTTLKIKSCVFDRGGYRYHGRVKALAEGVRAGGINI